MQVNGNEIELFTVRVIDVLMENYRAQNAGFHIAYQRSLDGRKSEIVQRFAEIMWKRPT